MIRYNQAMGAKTLLTVRDLERMPDDDTVQVELDEGELITTAPASDDHGYLEGRIHSILWNFVKEHSLGRVYTGDTGFRLADDTCGRPMSVSWGSCAWRRCEARVSPGARRILLSKFSRHRTPSRN